MNSRKMGKIRRWLMWGARKRSGFTLIELLVVIIIIAMLAAIAIPTYLGQRQKAQDTAAYTLVRNALTVVQSATVETGSYLSLTADGLHELESTIYWVQANSNLVSVGSNPGISASVVAEAQDHQVAFYPESATRIDLASKSASGDWFGIQVDEVNLSQTEYVKVRVVDGQAAVGW